MPVIRPSSDLRNKYNEISEFCKKNHEPIYITKNGKGDLAVMSIETFENLVGKYDLYQLLNRGLEDIKNNETKPLAEAFAEIKKELYE